MVQACHDLVPPDVLAPVLRQLVDSFVHDRARPEVMTLGLKTVRELCTRTPLVMTPDLLQVMSFAAHAMQAADLRAAAYRVYEMEDLHLLSIAHALCCNSVADTEALQPLLWVSTSITEVSTTECRYHFSIPY